MRTIQNILKGRPINVGSIKVRELLPNGDAMFDPFLVFHHGVAVISPTEDPTKAGVGAHPHRGFSPVSFIYEGGVHHRDSRGNNSVVYAGGTQWTNAGMGLEHSERPPYDIQALGGVQELLQVWINTPAKYKMNQPEYFPLSKEDTPTITTPDGLVTLSIPAGELDGVKGKIATFFPVTTIMGTLATSGTYTFNFPPHHNTLLYVLSGALTVNDDTVLEAQQMALFNNVAGSFTIKANTNSKIFVGSGEPLNEPIAAHGPFVMNTQTEIMEAFRDYRMGKMGVLIED
jgi:redox-sensitive bicupin YhaK (pirin superfamily)